MAVFESCTKELVLRKYREEGILSGDKIINNDLSGIKCPNIQLNKVNITGSYLDQAFFSEMVCTDVSIVQSNCNSIQAMGGCMKNCHIYNCNVIKADFSKARLHGVCFENCIAHSIRFTSARITSSRFSECQMYKAKFDHCILIKVEFLPGSKGDLSTLQKAAFTHSIIIACSFSKVNLIGALVTNTVFIGCDFTGTSMDEIDQSTASFINCTFNENEKTLKDLTNLPAGNRIF